VVGEDLGTVPPEMSRAMAERVVYSYRVLLFEKNADGSFHRPDEYPRRAIATVTTHDLPTLNGYWSASDIELRQRLQLYPSAEVRQRVQRERVLDRAALLAALGQADLISAKSDQATVPCGDALSAAVHAYLARSRSALVVLQAEDLVGMPDPVNVPGTSDEHANWQRKMSCRIEEVFGRPQVRRLLDAVQRERSRPLDPAS
jgi:4-alpha-glucanotransferase